jgi:hypothetical protein
MPIAHHCGRTWLYAYQGNSSVPICVSSLLSCCGMKWDVRLTRLIGEEHRATRGQGPGRDFSGGCAGHRQTSQ